MKDLLDEKWMKWVALTTTIFAVCAAISSLKASSFSTKIQLNTTLESNRWGHYQAKSIKQNMMKMERDMFALSSVTGTSPEAKKYIDAQIKECDGEIARYEIEKNEIRAEAEKIAEQEKGYKHRNGNFATGVMFLQIAIMLSSVGALLRKKASWISGIAVGVTGIFFMAHGFLAVF